MSSPDGQRRRTGYNWPDTEPTTSHTVTTSTTYISSSSSSFGIDIGSANPAAALLPSQNLPPGLRIQSASRGYETSWPTSSTTTHTTRDAHDEFIRREEQKTKLLASVGVLFILLVLALLLILTFVGGGSGGKSSWSIWIPLGPVLIGYGSEGFQWGIWIPLGPVSIWYGSEGFQWSIWWFW